MKDRFLPQSCRFSVEHGQFIFTLASFWPHSAEMTVLRSAVYSGRKSVLLPQSIMGIDFELLSCLKLQRIHRSVLQNVKLLVTYINLLCLSVSAYLSVCLSVSVRLHLSLPLCLSVSVPISPPICLSVCLYFCLFVRLPLSLSGILYVIFCQYISFNLKDQNLN